MRCICLVTLPALLAVLPATALAQTSGGPTVAIDITAADIQATLDSPEGGIDRQIRIVDMGAYNLAVGIIHRGATTRDGPVMGITHSQVAETYYITSGSGTLVTGGRMVNARELPPESQGRSEQPHFGRNAIGCGSKIRLRRPIGAMKCWLARRINGPNRQEVASMCPAPALARPMGAWAPRYPVA